MRGDLAQTSAADLCRRLADQGATGTLTIHHPEGEGRIRLREGAVHSAESPAPRARLGDRLVNAALLSQDELLTALEAQAASDEHIKLGAILVDRDLVTRDVIRVFVQEQILDALFEITGWSEGDYEFTPAAAPQDRLPVELSVDQTLVEIARRQSEWDQLRARIPSLDMVPDFVTGGSTAAASLEPDEFAVLASVDGERSIRELAADLGYSEFEAARIVYGLMLLGIVDVQRDEDAVPVERDDLEVELEVADGPTPDEPAEIDVAAALEEALLAAGREPAVGDAGRHPEGRDDRPEVRIHGGDDGFQWDALEGPVEDQRTPPPPEPTPGDDLSGALRDVLGAVGADESGATDDAEQGPAAPEREPVIDAVAELAELGREADAAGAAGAGATDDSPGDDEGEPGEAWSRDALDEESSDEPEVFVLREEDLEDEPPRAPASGDGGFGFFAGTAGQPGDDDAGTGTTDEEEPAAAPPGDGTGDDFDRLLDELAGNDDGGPGPDRPYTSTPAPEADERAGADERAEADERASGGGTSGEGHGREDDVQRADGDVSEFLRELSRLAIDEPDRGPDDREDDDRSDASRAADAAADAKSGPPPARREDDDKGKKKKGGLFGWGR